MLVAQEDNGNRVSLTCFLLKVGWHELAILSSGVYNKMFAALVPPWTAKSGI